MAEAIVGVLLEAVPGAVLAGTPGAFTDFVLAAAVRSPPVHLMSFAHRCGPPCCAV
jgi:hypothetical protein